MRVFGRFWPGVLLLNSLDGLFEKTAARCTLDYMLFQCGWSEPCATFDVKFTGGEK